LGLHSPSGLSGEKANFSYLQGIKTQVLGHLAYRVILFIYLLVKHAPLQLGNTTCYFIHVSYRGDVIL